MLISIFASVWAWNLWDELILKNEIKLLKKQYPNSKFIVYSYDINNIFFEDKYIKYVEYFPLWIRNIKNILKNIKNFFLFIKYTFLSDLIVIWWWGLFFDNEVWNKRNSLFLWFFRLKIFELFLKKIYFFRISIDIKNKKSLEYIKKIFIWKRKIIEVRDDYSKEILKSLGIWNIKKNYDPVFYDKNDNIKEIINKKVSIKKIFSSFSLKDLENIDFENKNIWIAFRAWYLSKEPEIEIWMIKEIIIFIQKKWWNVVFLPHSFNKDDISSNDFIWMNYIKKDLKNIWITKSLQETYNYYKEKRLDIVLAQRLHSIILSQVYEIAYIAISYSRKTFEILNQLK